MARQVAIGKQDFESIRVNNYFYIDKTYFIKEWWDCGDDVTLITRPRRFGKTLTLNMVEKFFSVAYADRTDLFEGLSIWREEKYRIIQGTYPVISLSFANIKESSFIGAKRQICQLITELYNHYQFLTEIEGFMTQNEVQFYHKVSRDMDSDIAAFSLYTLSKHLMKYYGKKVIILLDEYDTPMQEAYVDGYWNELEDFTRGIFNAAFKTNPYLERAIMTGITRLSKESIFSDLNNLCVVTTTSDKYADCFGFTQAEVKNALQEYDLTEQSKVVKDWYDGFTFGQVRDIYNPWSIINFLSSHKLGAYWANTSSNHLIGKVIREGNNAIKQDFEHLLRQQSIEASIDEQIVYNQLQQDEKAIWSLLLASGYLKVKSVTTVDGNNMLLGTKYELELTNLEVMIMFQSMVHDWFANTESNYNDFIKALLQEDIKAMNAYMNRVSQDTFSYFDTGKSPSRVEPERFYHGFVLGLIVDLRGRFAITSNRESGFGRYDVLLEPLNQEDDAYIIEFKVHDSEDEKDLQETVQVALQQIEDKKYEQNLIARGIPAEHICKYGFAFEGKRVLIGKKA